MHVLVIDVEFLVALEAEQILTEHLACTVEIAVPRDMIQTLQSRRFDILLLDAALMSAAVEPHVRRLREAGTGIVFSSVDSEHRRGLPGFFGIPVMSRPFDDEELVRIVRRAAISG
ncbi:hypothetical protein [Rhizobium sp. RU35A]|uniref:hypothetical protein n=1 Tax=Rhizobium sp. RU35A TaxID=1907414 RepID=UPI00165F4BB8|nr:hypothetical protein [Rhizobium sp. RU35A]